MKYATLVWIKPTIDDTLKLTRQSLEQFVENPEDTGSLQKAIEWLSEIRGALIMLDTHSAVMLIQSMEMVIKGLLSGQIKNKEQAYDSLMRCLIQLPNYLAHLSLGYPDIPAALLPLNNKLRVMYAQKPLQISQVFSPDLTVALPLKAAPKYPDDKLKAFVQQKRIAYQKGLIAWIKAKNIAGLKLLLTTLEQLQQVTGTTPLSRAWWITGALLESIAQKGLPTNAAILTLIKQMDGLMKVLVTHGAAALSIEPPVRLLNQLLFYVAHSKSKGPRTTQVRQTYQLDYSFPSQELLQSSLQIFSGPDIELMGIIVNIMKEDFARIEETLDIFMRADDPDASDLLALVDIMRNMAYTLSLLDMDVQAKSVLKQLDLINKIGQAQQDYDLACMLEIANQLLQINAALDTLASQGTHARQQIQQEKGLLQTQFKEVLIIVVEEAKIELAEIIPALISFIDGGEVDDELRQIPSHFKKISGLFMMLNRQRAKKLIDSCSQYVENVMIQRETVPSETACKALADTIISFELYLDTVAGNPLDDNQILDITERCLSVLTA